MRVKTGKKQTRFSTLRTPARTDLCFFLTEIHITKTVDAFLLNNLFLIVFVQNVISKFVKVLPQSLNNSLLEKSRAHFCAVAC